MSILGSFVLAALDYVDFRQAIRLKLFREISHLQASCQLPENIPQYGWEQYQYSLHHFMVKSGMQPSMMNAVLAVFFVFVFGPFAGLAHADKQVDLELILAIDVSGSVNEEEYALQVEGLSAAFRDPGVIAAISRAGPNGIAIAIVQWSGRDQHDKAEGWVHLHSRQSIEAFASQISEMERKFWAGDTLLGRAMNYASRLFFNNGFSSKRKVIDISGDGGVESLGVTARARDGLVAAGFTINGLAVETDVANLSEFYRLNVIGGFGAFVMSARDYTDFKQAIRRKLIREISPLQLSAPHPSALH